MGRKITIRKSQLRRFIRESCGLDSGPTAPPPAASALQMELPAVEPTASVPVPEDYEATRDFLDMNPELGKIAIAMLMRYAGTSCERSTAQAMLDHLADMLGA